MSKWSKNPIVREGQKARRKAALKERFRADPAFRKRENRKEGLRQYGITLDDYERLRTLQNNMCGICDREPMVGEKGLSVDHNHETRYIRGLLCFHCNVGLGHFMDSVPLLCRAIQWLTERNG
jgi:hypothetical protein